LSETYRHRVTVMVRARVRVGVRVRFSVKFRNLHNYISDKINDPSDKMTCNPITTYGFTALT